MVCFLAAIIYSTRTSQRKCLQWSAITYSFHSAEYVRMYSFAGKYVKLTSIRLVTDWIRFKVDYGTLSQIVCRISCRLVRPAIEVRTRVRTRPYTFIIHNVTLAALSVGTKRTGERTPACLAVASGACVVFAIAQLEPLARSAFWPGGSWAAGQLSLVARSHTNNSADCPPPAGVKADSSRPAS